MKRHLIPAKASKPKNVRLEMVEYVDLNIDELLLDQDNPRLGAVGSQSEALEALVTLNPGHFRTLMLSIKKNGLDPGDSFYVIKADYDEDYIALEGNRRLSALKMLANPNFVVGTQLPQAVKDSLVKTTSGFDRTIIEPLRCVLFNNRAQAHDWIYRRHTGMADGEGRVDWGPTEIQRFSGDRSILDVIDFVGRNADYSEEQWALTKSIVESKKSTNLSRLLDSAAGRKHLRISILKTSDEQTPLLSSDPTWALSVLKRIIEDVRDGVVDSRALNKAADIERYFASLPRELQPRSDRASSSKPFKEITLRATSGETKASSNTTKKKSDKASTPRLRVSLSPKKHDFLPPSASKGQRLLHEAASLDAGKYTIAAAFLLRSFIEASVEEYMKKNKMPKIEVLRGGKKSELSLSQCAERVADHIQSTGEKTKKDLHGFRSHIISKTSPASIESLNGFIHNKYQIPTPEALRAAWDSAVPIFMSAFGVPDAK